MAGVAESALTTGEHILQARRPARIAKREERQSVMQPLSGSFASYTAHTRDDRPIGAYASLIALFHALVAAEIVAARRQRAGLPERLGARDIVLLGLATHKLSRLLTKDMVTSVLRAPFTTFEGNAGDGEVREGARGTGLQHAVGELLTCPFCFGQWVLAVLAFGLVTRPRQTRFLAGLCASLTLADFLQTGYGFMKKQAG
jgi:hypothetical protein